MQPEMRKGEVINVTGLICPKVKLVAILWMAVLACQLLGPPLLKYVNNFLNPNVFGDPLTFL